MCGDEVSSLLGEWREGDETARDELFKLLHCDLSRIASRLLSSEQKHISLFTGDLVNEATLRLLQAAKLSVADRNHLLALSARVMRHVLLDRARSKSRHKRKGIELTLSSAERNPSNYDFNLLKLEHALLRLHAIDPQRAEIVEMRYFGGMTIDEVSGVVGISPATVKRKWDATRLWLQEAMNSDIE